MDHYRICRVLMTGPCRFRHQFIWPVIPASMRLQLMSFLADTHQFQSFFGVLAHQGCYPTISVNIIAASWRDRVIVFQITKNTINVHYLGNGEWPLTAKCGRSFDSLDLFETSYNIQHHLTTVPWKRDLKDSLTYTGTLACQATLEKKT